MKPYPVFQQAGTRYLHPAPSSVVMNNDPPGLYHYTRGSLLRSSHCGLPNQITIHSERKMKQLDIEVSTPANDFKSCNYPRLVPAI